ncbi:dihydrofolate reductase [Rhizobium sp. ERR 922]|uniref:dihydrofolate reductase family protein n=1 Tax=unclassified Rhizobium TaxID=2613769 RepID=UPI000DE0B8CE|nr:MULTISPECIES: dihydrofolate reductase family protein [unclassified Rhizobium]MCZ3378665.1 dihydrofolate reductase family protein [Rhizobium sp. AG207R]TWB19579.1 dihydrofolate reductase [Rhizobium sp. ERR1071]TWB54628.1 dihydrofolate reductase [Rhizobium sp. ERR 922]TWB98038.1 dihydrofolate reductase [Rhizobium sp. ERR 942]
MRKVIAATFISLDGVMQAPGGPDEDPTGGFEYGGWVFPHADEETGKALFELFEKPFDLLLGRKTYDIFSAFWPYVGDDDPIGQRFNSVVKYVATRGDAELKWNKSQSLGKDVVAAIKGLKAGEGPDLLIQGSGDLIQTLLRHRLIDEFKLVIFPVVLGGGKKLFAGGAVPAAMKLLRTQSSSNGVIFATYQPDGPVKTGSFVGPNPSEEEIERRKRLQ